MTLFTHNYRLLREHLARATGLVPDRKSRWTQTTLSKSIDFCFCHVPSHDYHLVLDAWGRGHAKDFAYGTDRPILTTAYRSEQLKGCLSIEVHFPLFMCHLSHFPFGCRQTNGFGYSLCTTFEYKAEDRKENVNDDA